MRIMSFLQVATVSALALTVGTSAAAQTAKIIKVGIVEEVSGSDRINFSGKLRMLSQRIPATACYAHAGIETEKAQALLLAATDEFDLIINGLEFGESALNIKGAESDRKILIGLKKLTEIWNPVHDVIYDVAKSGGTGEEVAQIAATSAPMLKVAKKLVSEISGEYADPTALLQTDAMTIDIAGRQRMLAQRISKNVCLSNSGFAKDQALAELAAARDTYDASVNALRYGMPEAGINATDNPEILAGLDEILALWDGVQPILTSVSEGTELSSEQKSTVYNTMNKLTGKMNTLVGMYNDDSKLGL